MSEIEKLYKNAGVDYQTYIVNTNPPVEYPQIDFTADKQLGLIKWMIKTNHRYFIQDVFECEFEESLAKVLNLYWQDLIESEQEQIADILRG